MRITQSMMTRNYLRGLSRNLSDVAKSNSRLASMRKFDKVSEDTAGATRAFVVRERLYRSESYLDTISGAAGELASTESTLLDLNDILTKVKEKTLKAVTGSSSDESRKIIAGEIKSLKGQALQLLNSKFGDKFLFGGSNNSTAAFEEVGGKLTFNGVDVDTITKNAAGEYEYPDPNNQGAMLKLDHTNARYLDIGLGMTMVGNNVDQKTAFQINTLGIDAAGFGYDADGKSNNIYNILSEIETALNNNDPDTASEVMDRLTSRSDDLMRSTTEIGSKVQFLENMTARFESDILTLQTQQKELELINTEEESIYNASYYATWMVTLKLGNKLIPPSLFDYMN